VQSKSVTSPLTKGVVWGMLGGLIIWIGLLIRIAYKLRVGPSEAEGHAVLAGPFMLTVLGKQPIKDGFVVQFSLRPGLLYFLLFCAGLGLLFGWLAHRAKKVAHS
jgi:hypothetical protein